MKPAKNYSTLFAVLSVVLNTLVTCQPAVAVSAKLTTVQHFTVPRPKGALLLAQDGNFYGTTAAGGTHAAGVIFKLTPAGVYTILYNFLPATDGSGPMAKLFQNSTGDFYGTTTAGGQYGFGTIYKYTLGGALSVIHNFASTDGTTPVSALILGSDGKLYGTASTGGTNNGGTAFSCSLTGTFSVLHRFGPGYYEGVTPVYSLLEVSPGVFDGTAIAGGQAQDDSDQTYGTIYQVTSAGGYSVLYTFHYDDGSGSGNGIKPRPAVEYVNALDPQTPASSLIRGTDGALYGVSNGGGTIDDESNGQAYTGGTIYRYANGAVTTFFAFDPATAVSNPLGEFSQDSSGNFYGLTQSSRTYYAGLYKVSSGAALVASYDAGTEAAEVSSYYENLDLPPVLAGDGSLYGVFTSDSAQASGLAYKLSADFTSLTHLRGFTSSTPLYPFYVRRGMTRGTDGNYYGVTSFGGLYGHGTAFKYVPGGALTTLYSFAAANAVGGIIQGTDGNLYGTTYAGGSHKVGTVYKLTLAGKLTVLHNFTGADGNSPGALIQAANGVLYGVTEAGGANSKGTLFKITTAGAFTHLHDFTNADGEDPQGPLLQVSDGSFYGATYRGGANNDGAVFHLSADGMTVTLLASFNGSNGQTPNGGLILATDGNFYGTTLATSGASEVFRVTPQGVISVAYAFQGGTSPGGNYAYCGLVQSSDGNLYGLNSAGYGATSGGTVYQLTLSGTFSVLHTFTGGLDGAEPTGPLIDAGNLTFYGLTNNGGTTDLDDAAGTIFKLKVSP